MATHCSECGLDNAEGANYCQRCGAHLGGPEPTPEDSVTATYRVGETGELIAVDLQDVVASEGAALVIRSGGGRVGESFPLHVAAADAEGSGSRLTIGRRPDADVFLDDVTVSRDHALLVHRADGWHLDDLGSLNGTYVNRERIESHKLIDADEVQVGKYKLTFLQR